MDASNILFHPEYLIKIYLLGEFKITNIVSDDLTPSAAKAQCILAILALSEKGEITRHELTKLLWSRHAQEQARTSLRQSLSLLRRIFKYETANIFSADRHNVYLKLDRIWIDSDEVINNTTQLLENETLTTICSGTLLENLNVNDPEFTAWLHIKKQTQNKIITLTLQNHLAQQCPHNTPKKHKALLHSLLKFSPSACTPPSDTQLKPSIIKNNATKKKLLTFNNKKIHLSRDVSLYRNMVTALMQTIYIATQTLVIFFPN